MTEVSTTVTYDDRPVILTIAGFDPSGGTGIIADIRTFLAFGCLPTAAITSLTFQNSDLVRGAIHQTAESLRSQILPITAAYDVAAIKTGMLPTREIVLEVVRLLREKQLPAPVVDPVMRSSSGYKLMDDDAVRALLSELIPLARLITPNIPEAEALTGRSITTENEMGEAARKLREMGARAVLVKGGHRPKKSEVRSQRSEIRGQRGTSPTVREGSEQAIDILDDEGRVTIFRGDWIEGPPIRGTGCMLSSALAAAVSRGTKLEDAVRVAKEFVAQQIRRAVQLETRNPKLET